MGRLSVGGELTLPVGGGLPLLALGAEAVQLELVVRDREAVLLGDPVLQLRDALVLELRDVAAGGADKVVVVVAVARRSRTGLAALDEPRRGQRSAPQSLTRAVHCTAAAPS